MAPTTYSCRSPLKATRKPRTAVPANACDAHIHIAGPLDRFPYVANPSYMPPPALVGEYEELAAILGIERMVVVQASFYGMDNSCTLAAIEQFGVERARGIAVIDADVSKAELLRLHRGGIRGTRFSTTASGGPALDQLTAVAAKTADLGWHIEVQVPIEVWPDLLPRIPDLPNPVLFDHMGGFPASMPLDDPRLLRMLDLLEAGKCWVKLCGYRNSLTGPPYADVAPLARAYIERAPKQCVWGTDWPHTMIKGEMPDSADLVDLLASWTPDAETMNRILVDNPARLYRF
jgi:predicted TIM-barrel fold metal-dependent hydrolase